MNGVINIYKPQGLTSNDIIWKVKKITGEKKIGHIGTLDPLAEGVLPLFLGKMTKLIPLFNLSDKTYRAVVRLGATSTTLDREGTITAVPLPNDLTKIEIEETLNSFLGKTAQVPPMYSAIKVKGKPLYKYARKGEEIERKPRTVTIHKIQDISWDNPNLQFTVSCSKGTYIRVLAEDIGKKLGTGAYLEGLTRTECGQIFSVETAFTLDQVSELNQIHEKGFLFPLQDLLSSFHKLLLRATDLEKIKHGMSIRLPKENFSFSDGDNEDEFKAVAFDSEENLVAIGDLEFSQDLYLRFSPSKVLI